MNFASSRVNTEQNALITMTAPTARIDPLVPDKGQAEDDDDDIFYDARSEVVSIRGIEADYDDDGEQFDEEGANNIDFKESVMMEYCSAIQKQLQLEFNKNKVNKQIEHSCDKSCNETTTSCLAIVLNIVADN